MTRSVASTTRSVPAALLVAAVLGGVHAGFSLYWAAGGTALTWSLGSDLVASFQGREWLLAPIGLIKLTGALVPLALAFWGWPARRLTRSACWLGASVLIIWGGLNTGITNLVLVGAIQPPADYDRPGMIGHAWLWDPLFLVWGVALAIGLFATRTRVYLGHGPGLKDYPRRRRIPRWNASGVSRGETPSAHIARDR